MRRTNKAGGASKTQDRREDDSQPCYLTKGPASMET